MPKIQGNICDFEHLKKAYNEFKKKKKTITIYCFVKQQLTDAIVNPRTMVIVSSYTDVAHCTVFGSYWLANQAS